MGWLNSFRRKPANPTEPSTSDAQQAAVLSEAPDKLDEQQARQAAIAQRGPIVVSWLNIPADRDGRRFLEAHLDLLQPSTDDVLVSLINQYHDQPGAATTLQQHLALLQEIRRRGGDI